MQTARPISTEDTEQLMALLRRCKLKMLNESEFIVNRKKTIGIADMPNIREITITEKELQRGDVKLLRFCTSLTALRIEWCTGCCDLLPLAVVKSLQELRVDVLDELISIVSLQQLPALKKLTIKNNSVTNDDVHAIAHIDTLEVVELGGCKQLTHVGALGRLPLLRELNLSRTPVTDEGIRGLRESRSLVKIDLSNCNQLTDVSSLGCNDTLQSMELCCCNGLATLGGLRCVLKLRLDGDREK